MPDPDSPLPPSSPHATSAFAPTRWSLVLRSQGPSSEARVALAELCDAYYQPVFRFLRREGRDDDEARELTQEFFARILERGRFGAADHARGRFRSYLLGAVKHFLADRRKHLARAKRGGGVDHASIDGDHRDDDPETSAMQLADDRQTVQDAWFDREWALAVMARTLGTLESDARTQGKAEQFAILQPWLAGDAESLSQADAARQLRLSEGAVKVAIHRLRKRFRECLQDEIAQTLGPNDDVQAELRYLIEALATRP